METTPFLPWTTDQQHNLLRRNALSLRHPNNPLQQHQRPLNLPHLLHQMAAPKLLPILERPTLTALPKHPAPRTFPHVQKRHRPRHRDLRLRLHRTEAVPHPQESSGARYEEGGAVLAGGCGVEVEEEVVGVGG